MLHQSQLGLSKVEVVCICSAGSELQGNKHFLDLLERLKLRKNSWSVHQISLAGENLAGLFGQYDTATTHSGTCDYNFTGGSVHSF